MASYSNTIQGNQGNDILLGSADGDRIAGGTGNDFLWGNRGADFLAGGDGSDSLYGDSGDDTLLGGAGADLIVGGSGRDVVTGGAGADLFLFNTLQEADLGVRDLITDFDRGDGDRIDLSGIDANTRQGGDQAFRFIGQGSFGGVAGQLRASVEERGLLIEGDVNGDQRADFQILLVGVGNPSRLAASDLIL